MFIRDSYNIASFKGKIIQTKGKNGKQGLCRGS